MNRSKIRTLFATIFLILIATSQHACVVAPPPGGTGGPGGPLPVKPSIEPNVNRPGMDYTSFKLNKPKPKICRNACAKDPKCRAYTYVKPGVQGPKARCWLKHGVPAPQHNPCCVSGVK